jgi:hypothetical protein
MNGHVFGVGVLVLVASLPAGAQTLPSGPFVVAGGHVAIGGDASASVAPQDPGFFNFTDYEHSALRMVRFDLSVSVTAGDHFTVLGGFQDENFDTPRVYALYVRIHPWSNRRFDVQIGRVPPTAGLFAHQTYATDNILIGYPLAYQYLTSLRPDALPASADDLLRMRARGWESSFPVGNQTPDHGVPLFSGFRWDTGVQVHAATDLLEVTASVTTGTLSNPLVGDDNGGKQIAGRAAIRPVTGLAIGASAARGAFISDAAASAVPGGADANAYTQTALGGDIEYSRDYFLVRAETMWSRWTVPPISDPLIDVPLRAFAVSLEGRYKLRPGLYAAARVDHLGFSDITGTAGSQSWEARLSRVEFGGGYYLQRNLVLKLSYQYNTRDGGRQPTLGLPAAQLVYWF